MANSASPIRRPIWAGMRSASFPVNGSAATINNEEGSIINAATIGVMPCMSWPKTGTPYDVSEEREPCNQHNPMRSPHFGDMHVHTAWSFDASSQDTRNTPLDAYEFAQGKLTGIQPYDENDQAVRHLSLIHI